MLNIFKQKTPVDVKALRHEILEFIKEQLKKAESGEGENIRALQLYITCREQDKFLYEAAVYADKPDEFKDAVQKIADDFAIDLPRNWLLTVLFDEAAPAETIKAAAIDVALFVSTKQKPSVHKNASAFIKVVSGEAEKQVYEIHSSGKKINIGREKKVQTANGYLRENQIVFTDGSNNKSNKSVSRQHAHIEWNDASAAFFLYADEGGIPPSNKIKVRTVDGNDVRLLTTEIGHLLKQGDQIIIGESALLEFSYLS